MQFDPESTLTAICTITAVLGLQLFFFWIRDRRAPWLAWYAAAFIFGSAAVLLYILPADGREFLMYGAGNAARIIAFAFLWHGAREFAGRRPDQLVVVLAVAVWMALCSIPAFLGNIEHRVIGASIFVTLFCGLAATELWRNRAEALPSQMPCAIVCLGFAFFAAIRIPLATLAPFPVGARPLDPIWLAGFGLVTFVHATFLAALVPAMTRERRELEQRRFALSDSLTGLLNRRAFLDLADNRRHRRRSDTLAVLVLDLDHFKSINDRYGHEAGDLMLRHFADIARLALRPTDLLFRMGGEEFCVVLPNAGIAEARAAAERIRARFAESAIAVAGQSVTATVSIGVAASEQVGCDLERLLARGDAALYEAKARARNQTVVAVTGAPAPAGWAAA
jgi:diguanylate cyclase (GGDEF)-like protein